MDKLLYDRLRRIETKIDLVLGLAVAGAFIFAMDHFKPSLMKDWGLSENAAFWVVYVLFFAGYLVVSRRIED